MDVDVTYNCGKAGVGDAEYTDGEADWVVLTYPPSVLICLQPSPLLPTS